MTRCQHLRRMLFPSHEGQHLTIVPRLLSGSPKSRDLYLSSVCCLPEAFKACSPSASADLRSMPDKGSISILLKEGLYEPPSRGNLKTAIKESKKPHGHFASTV